LENIPEEKICDKRKKLYNISIGGKYMLLTDCKVGMAVVIKNNTYQTFLKKIREDSYLKPHIGETAEIMAIQENSDWANSDQLVRVKLKDESYCYVSARAIEPEK
jgi:AICAR transformylase/IMP cyclohydrolase PurH